jgi:hypothetical protein
MQLHVVNPRVKLLPLPRYPEVDHAVDPPFAAQDGKADARNTGIVDHVTVAQVLGRQPAAWKPHHATFLGYIQPDRDAPPMRVNPQ